MNNKFLFSVTINENAIKKNRNVYIIYLKKTQVDI